MIGIASKVCPHCSVEWTRNSDGTSWHNSESFLGNWCNQYFEDPVPKGAAFCPTCAAKSAQHADRVAFIRENSRVKDFLGWFLHGATPEDLKAMYAAFPPELLETRLAEYIDEDRGVFAKWRCRV